MKNYIAAGFLFFSSCILVMGQKPSGDLYLKDGSIIKGKVVENTPEVIKIEMKGGTVLAFSKDEVEKISYGNVHKPVLKEGFNYVLSFSGGSLIGSSKNDKQTPLSLILDQQLRFNSVSIGGVIGLEFLNEAVMPLGLSVKWITLIGNNTEFFVGCSGGYLYSLEEPYDPFNQIMENNGGSFVNPEVGIIFTSASRNRLFLAAGYRYSELHYIYNNWWYTEVEQDMYFDRFSIRFGLWFQ